MYREGALRLCVFVEQPKDKYLYYYAKDVMNINAKNKA